MDSSAIEGALEADARRGVAVTVIMTSDSDWDLALSQLESAGVRVVLYPDTSSALYIHAKVIDIDDTKAFVGSENFSTASLDYNRELGVITSPTAVLGPLNTTLSSDTSNGHEQQGTSTLHRPRRRPRHLRNPDHGVGRLLSNRRRGWVLRAGEYCRDDDHGMAGRAGDGQAITCDYDNGNRYWESS